MRDGPALRMGPTTGSVRGTALARRLATMLWGVPLVLVCLWLGGWWLTLAAAVLCASALAEFWPLGRPLGVHTGLRWEVLAAAALLLVGATLGPTTFSLALTASLLLVLVAGVVRAAATPGGPALREQLGATVWAMAAIIYIPWLLGHLLLLRASGPDGHGWSLALFTVVAVWVGDVGAYVAGGWLGRHRLAAAVSPGKSVEGAVAAVVLGAAAGVALAGTVGQPAEVAGLVGAVLAATGMAGDLWESLLKRSAEVKDSGGGVPGHGGVLDRFDSLLLGAPVAYWLLERVPWTVLLRLLHLTG